ncbi:MAG: SLBB domain-containing protein, partial [Deltaproteobacteria bacterium]|nr:SLBB domain-containing protein [Deltaproteobacteria bacterium]
MITKSGIPIQTTTELEIFRKGLVSKVESKDIVIRTCACTACAANGGLHIIDKFKSLIEQDKARSDIRLKVTNCFGFYENNPQVVVSPPDIQYLNVMEKDVEEIYLKTVKESEIIDRLLFVDPVTGEVARHKEEIPFYKKQKRVVLRNFDKIDPLSIEDYIAVGGYGSLAKVLAELEPDEVISIIEKSGLRGRGGGGFPTGKKWKTCRRAQGDMHYVVCNGDEGDPGAFMDRAIMEGDPHSIIEGMIIGAYAIGSDNGFIYVRMEYPFAVDRLLKAIHGAREYGFLGKNILGSDFDFDIRLNRGGGAFVCGESTALMASLEGRAGEPRAKYIHTVEKGLWNQPTTLNNAETWANVPVIMENGADWFASLGTEGSTGTKVFSLVGKVNNTGLVEVPMGITLREILFDIGGGVKGKRKFKA